jgi:hypothetical protein
VVQVVGTTRVTLCRLALGVPSRLTCRALDLAGSLIQKPASQGTACQGVEREAGYIVISALCVGTSTETFDVRLCQMCSFPSKPWNHEAAAQPFILQKAGPLDIETTRQSCML